ncbi:PREDICTED: endoglucanase 2-like [Tarenaya hassleriana]|uniref:endoglucanase 2-like n=1 Tax=Tarenaya hassleriana TaxID=28532 RepID=UPI0008FCE539|nr:PREDICTED: endoglucanase 2-like [Tarenaya hassleriana]
MGGCCCRWFLVTLVLISTLGAIGYVIHKKLSPNSGETHRNPAGGYLRPEYTDALSVALEFFDVQRSGKLVKNRISWRGDSGLRDGREEKVDLSKGMYDAGDHIKFGFPMAFTPATDSLRWITDFLLNAHVSPNVLYIQVGDPELDHNCWDRPETMSEIRPLTQINREKPGSDVAAETSAALAAASIVFKHSDPNYSTELLMHAKDLFQFADSYKGLYSLSVPEVQEFYNSSGFGDELLWAASWLFHATGDEFYYSYVVDNGETFADFGNPRFFSWNDKLPGVQVLLSRLSFFGSKNESENDVLRKYKQTAESVMCILLPRSPTASPSRTQSKIISFFRVFPCGLIWVSEWNALQEAVASAFLASLYADYIISSPSDQTLLCGGQSFDPSELKSFAKSQVDYVLGQNPMNMSYLVGYGDSYPRQVHHRGASIPANATTGCTDGFVWLMSEEPNPNVAVGALVGGPFLNETYVDDRNNTMQAEPTTYNTAATNVLVTSFA